MSLRIQHTSISGLMLIHPQVFGDERAFFLESYSQREYAKHSISTQFVQDNHSKSSKGVLRGMHFQKTKPQSKLVRVVRGSVYDIALDLCPESPTYGKWEGFLLSAENKTQLFVPQGFAHGFLTLEDETEFLYKCDNYYDPSDEGGIIWNDPELNIDWGKCLKICGISEPIISGKDQLLPNFISI